MRMVVLGAAVGAVLVGAGPVSAQVVVHDRDRVVVREHVDHGFTVITTDGVITMPNAVQYTSGPVFQTAISS